MISALCLLGATVLLVAFLRWANRYRYEPWWHVLDALVVIGMITGMLVLTSMAMYYADH